MKTVTYYSRDNRSYTGLHYAPATTAPYGSKWLITIRADNGHTIVREKLLANNTPQGKCNYLDIKQALGV